jgi:ribosomal protein S27AE
MNGLKKALTMREGQSFQSEHCPESKVLFNGAHDDEQETKPKDPNYERGILFCPRCGSTNIFWASGLPHLWSIWQCKNCGYRGALVVRNGKLAEKVREDYEKRTAK